MYPTDPPPPAPNPPRERDGRRRGILVVATVSWCLVVAFPPLALNAVREDWMRKLDRPEVAEDWERFREDMRRQSGRDGPVQRKVPRSAEPPGLVWLRDHFSLACSAWMLFGTVLWGMVTLFAWGAAGPRVNEEPSPAAGGGHAEPTVRE